MVIADKAFKGKSTVSAILGFFNSVGECSLLLKFGKEFSSSRA